MRKYTFFLSVLLLMGLNGGNPCPPNLNCNFSLPKPKGMQIKEIEILSPKADTDWRDEAYHTIVWKWIPKEKTKKRFSKAIFYLLSPNGTRKKKLFSKRAIMGFYPNKLYKTEWYIDKNIYSFPGFYKLRIETDNSVYGESMKFHISKEMHTITLNLEPKIYNRYFCKSKKTQNPITVDESGTCYPSPLQSKYMLRVGFENSFRKYGPFNENSYQCNCVYRGYLVFDLSSINSKESKVLSAKLISKKIAPQSCTFGETATNNCNCIGEIDYFGGNGHIKFNTPANFYANVGSKQTNIDVSGIVRKKIAYGAKRVGFKLIGRDESYARDNSKCVGLYSNVHLKIKLLQKGPRVHQFPKPH